MLLLHLHMLHPSLHTPHPSLHMWRPSQYTPHPNPHTPHPSPSQLSTRSATARIRFSLTFLLRFPLRLLRRRFLSLGYTPLSRSLMVRSRLTHRLPLARFPTARSKSGPRLPRFQLRPQPQPQPRLRPRLQFHEFHPSLFPPPPLPRLSARLPSAR